MLRHLRFYRPRSLKSSLWLAIFSSIVLSIGIEAVLTDRYAIKAVNAAYDRALLGAIQAIANNITDEGAGVSVELPYALLEFFQLTAAGEIYYRVTTQNGLVDIGDVALPRSLEVKPGISYSNVEHLGMPVRLASYWLSPKSPQGHWILIQLAESLSSREAFSQQLRWASFQRYGLLLLLTVGLMALLVRLAMSPLMQLRSEVSAKMALALDDPTAGKMSPITANTLTEVQPLVNAINTHINRLNHFLSQRRQFVDDASHQLRTPLTTLLAQVDYAINTQDEEEKKQGLQAIRDQVQKTVQSTNQILALARADSAALFRQKFDLNDLARELCRQYWANANLRKIHLSFEETSTPLILLADRSLVREAISNLLDNAIRYNPSGTKVAICLTLDPPTLTLQDDGQGVPDESLPLMGQRFYRPRSHEAALEGSGLGIAFAKAVIERHGGTLAITSGQNGRGLCCRLMF